MQCKSDGNMEDVATEKTRPPWPDVAETHDEKSAESAENFQKFMYELFEKNGVLNDLRAYLRGHIVGILRSARTGDPPACQKNFTQRLELQYQALNMLVAEYLLRLEFSYSLSVFISEIPLANMVLDLAKSLMHGDYNNATLRFKDEDVWSILNYLGVKCDSEHAFSIVKMYRQEDQLPLLVCMLKSMPRYTPINLGQASSQESLSSSVKSCDNLDSCSRPRRATSCKHLAFCKTCQKNINKIEQSYKNKKNTLAKNIKESNMEPHNVESLMQNVDVIERSLIDEMFEELKSVYEGEMQMAKAEEEERVKRSLATHAVLLKKKRIEMEETFKARELELARTVQQKKRFLWGLARLLRDQHRQMALAMRDLQAETNRLTAKEESLKSQLAEAEEELRSRGTEMRRQIANELAILEQHLDSMKKERNTINKERSELEHMKILRDSREKTTNIESTKDDLYSHYDSLRNEFSLLKKCLETVTLEPKCVIERSTLTEDDLTRYDGILNNGQDFDRSRSEDRVKAKQVVNDLKKMKNVNFSQSNLAEIYRDRSRSSPSHSSASSEGEEAHNAARPDAIDTSDATRRDPNVRRRDTTQNLVEENERLRSFARQQREHIDELSSHRARLEAELTAARQPFAPPVPRPRTAPAALPNNGFLQRMTANTSSEQSSGHGWRKGAGEEMSFFANIQPRIVVPGDTLPFIGVVRDRHHDNRRHLINQWRSLRRRISPVTVGKSRTFPGTSASTRELERDRANSVDPSVRTLLEEETNVHQNTTLGHSYKHTRDHNDKKPKSTEKSVKTHEKNPRLALKEVKERLKSKEHGRCSDHELTPNAVIRDAKLRLRKLEIEAEAVEKSYMDFRRKHEARRKRSACLDHDGETNNQKDIDLKPERSSYKTNVSEIESTSHYIPPQDNAMEQIIEDIEEYHRKYDIGALHFKNRNATWTKVRPIPCDTQIKTNQNYLDTSMAEFRTYYHSEKRGVSDGVDHCSRVKNRDVECPAFRTPSKSPRLDEQQAPSPVTHRNINSEESDLQSTERFSSLSRNAELIESTESNSPRNKYDIPTNQENTDLSSTIVKGFRAEVYRQTNQDKVKELEILKQNISKIYNLPEAENNDNYEAVVKGKWVLEERNDIETITEASRDGTISEPGSKNAIEEKNLIRIEVQNVSQVNDVKISESVTQDLLLLVESSKEVEHSDIDFQKDMISTQMTILISPKKSIDQTEQDNVKSLDDGGKAIELSADDVLNSIYEADANENISSVNMQVENSKDILVRFLSNEEINGAVNDPDNNYSGDLDNINSLKYDTDHDRSPISMAKTSEDENFWDS